MAIDKANCRVESQRNFVKKPEMVSERWRYTTRARPATRCKIAATPAIRGIRRWPEKIRTLLAKNNCEEARCWCTIVVIGDGCEYLHHGRDEKGERNGCHHAPLRGIDGSWYAIICNRYVVQEHPTERGVEGLEQPVRGRSGMGFDGDRGDADQSNPA